MQGANIHHKNDAQETVLVEAVDRHDLEAIDFCIAQGVDTLHRNRFQETLLHAALNYVSFQDDKAEILTIVQKLVEAGVPINARDNRDLSALSSATNWGLTDVVDYLIAQGAEE